MSTDPVPPSATDPRVVHARISDQPLDPVALEQLVAGPADGAVTTFTGRVRDHDPEASGEVVSLDYSCHPDAEGVLRQVVAEVLATQDPEGTTHVAVAHRIGHLEVGDLAIVVSVASAHRAVTFTVCEALVEQVKARVPVWKHQHEADGRATWSNLGLA
ncbi:molybdenum cofactor biosynthesis protein MoaE [Kytococcus sedentarius]|uniref:molybdenum cofactor biosynthesis protein MoaE n=1 Tax=Kytococcus sedentarius TaxID=1276 RepID=UPI0035BC6D6B